MKTYYTPEALQDLISIGDWISRDNPDRSESFVEELILSCEEILNFPEKFPFVAQFESRGLRRKVHGNYLIFYRVKLAQLEIIHVFHGSRDYSKLLD